MSMSELPEARMSQSRFSLGQVLLVGVGTVVLVGVTALAGGLVGYQLGKADGQSLAQSQSRVVVPAPDGSGDQSFRFQLPFGNFALPQPLPFEGEIPPEFGAPTAYLGVRFEPITEDLAKAENLSVNEGAIIREVVVDSPAAKAGLQVGDVITTVDDEPVDAEHSLRDRVAAHKPNDTIELSVLRGEETLTIEVTLGESKGIIEHYQFRIPPDGSLPHFSDPSDCLPRGEQG
jgi:membrane-associated protease RseP (regulator of RpoE activity)